MATLTALGKTGPIPSYSQLADINPSHDVKFVAEKRPHQDTLEMRISFFTPVIRESGSSLPQDTGKFPPFAIVSIPFDRIEYPFTGTLCLKEIFAKARDSFYSEHPEFTEESRLAGELLQKYLTGDSEDERHLRNLVSTGAGHLDTIKTPPRPQGVSIKTVLVYTKESGKESLEHSGHTIHVQLALGLGKGHLRFQCNSENIYTCSELLPYPIFLREAPKKVIKAEPIDNSFNMDLLAPDLPEAKPPPTKGTHTFTVNLNRGLSTRNAEKCLTVTFRNPDKTDSSNICLPVGAAATAKHTARLASNYFSFKVQFPDDMHVKTIRSSRIKLLPDHNHIITISTTSETVSGVKLRMAKVTFNQEMPPLTFS